MKTTTKGTVMATTKTRTEAEIAAVIAGVDAGHRMAFHEPTDEMRETGRKILRGEISADDAVAASIAKYQAAEPR